MTIRGSFHQKLFHIGKLNLSELKKIRAIIRDGGCDGWMTPIGIQSSTQNGVIHSVACEYQHICIIIVGE